MAGEASEKYDILITDAGWRTAVTSVRSLGRAGLRVALGEAAGQFPANHEPPSFQSRYCAGKVTLPDGRNVFTAGSEDPTKEGKR